MADIGERREIKARLDTREAEMGSKNKKLLKKLKTTTTRKVDATRKRAGCKNP
jgi:hypothetical protein